MRVVAVRRGVPERVGYASNIIVAVIREVSLRANGIHRLYQPAGGVVREGRRFAKRIGKSGDVVDVVVGVRATATASTAGTHNAPLRVERIADRRVGSRVCHRVEPV